MKSMTGYGEASTKLNGAVINIQARSVNHRFFSIQINMSESLSEWTSRAEEITRKHIVRGSVNLSLKIDSDYKRKPVTLNMELVKSYYNQLKAIQKKLKLRDDISLNTILALSPLDTQNHKELVSSQSDWMVIEKAILKTLGSLVQMREREGARLKKELEAIVKKMQSVNDKIKKRVPEVIKHFHDVFSKRANDLLEKNKLNLGKNGTEPDSLTKRIAEEVAIFAQRADITEEIQRLNSHFNEFLRSMNQPGIFGKKLDFLTQEMLREVNTIGSKANDTEISYHTINLKTDIEKLKEQVQNIE
jgi:uncharacterized protein (TIGR00255 family)